MSHVLEIRKRTAEERLRGDHIEMMYQLQQANDLIEDLLKQIKVLELKVDGKSPVIEEPQDCGHRQEIESLQSEVLSLQSELKTLKTVSQMNEKSRKDMVKVVMFRLHARNLNNIYVHRHNPHC
jgi:glucose-6-phosphate-specific signal transduction histidine kinase